MYTKHYLAFTPATFYICLFLLDSTRVDEGRKSQTLLAIRKCKALAVAGKGEKSLLYHSGSEFSTRWERERRAAIIRGM